MRFLPSKKQSITLAALSDKKYGISDNHRAMAVELIVRRGIDRDNAWRLIFSASKMLAFLMGGLVFTVANQYPVVRAWLLDPYGILTFLAAIAASMWALVRSNRKTKTVSSELPNSGLHTAKDDAGQWWLIRRQSGEAEPLTVQDET